MKCHVVSATAELVRYGSERSTSVKVPWSESSRNFRLSLPGNESSVCGLFAPGTESARERRVQIPTVLYPCHQLVAGDIMRMCECSNL